jgi:putative FmdB family regulatory protein
MPSYDYACKSCRHTFEHLQRSSRDPAPPCPKCGAAVEKMLTAANVGASSGADRATFSELPRPRAGGGGCGRCGDPNGPCGA